MLELLRVSRIFHGAGCYFVADVKVDMVTNWARNGAVQVGNLGTARTVATG